MSIPPWSIHFFDEGYIQFFADKNCERKPMSFRWREVNTILLVSSLDSVMCLCSQNQKYISHKLAESQHYHPPEMTHFCFVTPQNKTEKVAFF